jgi:aspartyl-tRNA(Asn)/glutamyl-tRNA(Gln) amidotransferase subunit C
MLDKETVSHIARLARIGITEEEKEKYQEDLSRVLDFVEELSAFESQVQGQGQELIRYTEPREDREKNALPEVRERIMNNMPHTKDGSLSVQSVLSV